MLQIFAKIILRVCALIYSITLISYANNNDNGEADIRARRIGAQAQDNCGAAINPNELINDGVFLFGKIDLLSRNAPDSVKRVSGQIFRETGFKTIICVVYNEQAANLDSKERAQRFQARRDYEDAFLQNITGNYAAIFLFYNEHSINIRSNAKFINEQELLEEYAYPYLPAESIRSDKYKDGVNEGLSNLYLALAHEIAQRYNIELNAPKPMEKPDEATKVIIYVMLLILIVLFLLVSNGFFKKANNENRR